MDRILAESRESVTCPICADVFDDPRTLSCTHCFCLHCLIEFRGVDDGHANKFCPVCREHTVPPIGQIQALPRNDFASKVAKLIKESDRPNLQANARPAEDAASGDMFMGELIEDQEHGGGNSSLGVNVGVSVAAAAAVSVVSGGLFGIIAGLAVLGLGTASSLEAEKRRKRSYECNGCQIVQTSVLRYRCGMCDDFILCPSCFEDNRCISQLHNTQHFFLKLKFQQRRHLPAGGVLKPKVDEMVQTVNYETNKHGRAYVHSAQKLIILPSIQCKFCGISPIIGTRYKCGMCSDYDLCPACEQNSDNIHNKDHVFIALKNHSEINITSEPLLCAHFY